MFHGDVSPSSRTMSYEEPWGSQESKQNMPETVYFTVFNKYVRPYYIQTHLYINI